MKILHLDVETAPHKVYAWGLWSQDISINQIVEPGYTLCWAAKWDSSEEVLFNSIYKTSEDEMLQEMHSLLDEADAVTHYNGVKFDIPTLNKEFVTHGMGVPAPYHQIDLLQVAKKQFRFPSNKLDYVAQALGLGSKVKHKGMDLWRECMEGDAEAWAVMEEYNRGDVILLEKLYHKLLPWIKGHPNHALYKEVLDRPVCTNCGGTHLQSRGKAKTKTQEYARFQCVDCGTWVRGRTTEVDKNSRKNILTQA